MNEAKEIRVYEEDVFTKYVNANARKTVRAEKRAKAERKAINAIVKRAAVFSFATAAGLAFGKLGWVQGWLSAAATVTCAMCAMYNVGYYFGVMKGIKR